MKWYKDMKFKIGMSLIGVSQKANRKANNLSNWAGRMFWGVDNSSLATNETIFSIVTRISNTVSSLPLKLYKDHDVVKNNTSDVLINEPNEFMHGFDFINKMEVTRNEKGNAYALINRDIRAQIESLMPIDPNYVTPFINTDDHALWYEVRGNTTIYVHNSEIIHIKHITGVSRLSGLSPIDILKNTLEYDRAVQEFSLIQMQKPESFVLKYGANVSPEKRKAVIEDFRAYYKDNGGLLFQEPGVDIEPMEKKYLSSDTAQSEKITRSRVANVFNVPVSFLNDSEGQSYSSNEQLMTQFVQMTLTPIIRQYEYEFNRKLLTPTERKSGHYFKFNLSGLLRGDMTTRTAYYQAAIRNGWLSQDDVRKYEDEAPVGGNASKLWVSGDLYPIDMDPAKRKTTSKGGEED